MPKFLAHVGMRPLDGTKPYTIETEFSAASYPQAWQHIQQVAIKWKASIGHHRIQQIDENGELLPAGEPAVVIVPDADETKAALASVRRPPEVIALPAPPAEAATLTVNPVLDWLGKATMKMLPVLPYPVVEDDDNDTAAA